MNETKTLRITFRGPEIESLNFLMKELSAPTEQEVLRFLVKREADDRKSKRLTYGKGGEKQATKAERRRALEALDDTGMTAKLEELGCLSELRSDSADQVWIETAPTGRVIRLKSGATGMDETIPLQMMLNQWEKKGLI